MYIILRHYDGNHIPDWGAVINLSTLIALMGTFLRTMMVFVVSEIIGQAKWDYLASCGQPEQNAPVRRLIATSLFNDASQGCLGAVKLLPTIIRRPVTLTAVMVMIVSLGTGSFVQQAIQTQPCQFPEQGLHASLPISRNFSIERDDEGHGFGPTDISNTIAALASSLAPDSEELGSAIATDCSTGNCTFENPISGAHSTLGICSSCADTSPLIQSNEWEWVNLEATSADDPDTASTDQTSSAINYFTANYTLPNGMSVQASFSNNTRGPFVQVTSLLVSAEALGLDWAGDLVSSELKTLSQWAFANVTILTSNWLSTSSRYTGYIATTCTLYPCLRSYKASVMSGKLNQVLLSTTPAVPNVAAKLSPEDTSEDIQQAMQEVRSKPHYSHDTYEKLKMLSDTPLQAIQSPCLVNNTIWTKEDESSTLDTQRLVLLHPDPDPSGGHRFKIENTTAPAECIYSMDIGVQAAFVGPMVHTSFNGSCLASSFENDLDVSTMVDCGQAFWLTRFHSDEGTTAAAIIKRIEAFTERLSNKMRMGLLNSPETVYGQVLQMEVCSRIHYSWLAFPAVLVAVTNGLLAWTMFQSSRRRGRVMVWKTSILPFLFYSEQFVVQNADNMSADSTKSLSTHEGPRELPLDLNQMEAEAKQRRVRFEVFE